ncbi:MAG: hypothetical protein RLZZ592_100 [Pseudomonadota bacterium]|jgi:GT2 family glycosyltransferase
MSLLVSLVLATVGRTTEPARGLRALAAQSWCAVEVLVIDQNDDDRLVPIIAEARAAGLCVRHERFGRRSLSGARNHGLALAAGEIVGFPDDDCWYEPDTLRHLVAQWGAQEEGGSPALVVGCWVEQAQQLGVLAAPARTLQPGEVLAFRGRRASSITLFARTALLREIGGFDERFGVGQWFGSAEETDLVMRLAARGERMLYQPAIRVHHPVPPSGVPERLAPADLARLRARERGTGGLYAKHRLSRWVIGRGLVAPWLLPLLRGQLGAVRRGWSCSRGRLEGLRSWPGPEGVR